MSLSWIIIKSNNGEIITHNKFRSKLREKKLIIEMEKGKKYPYNLKLF